MRTTALAALVMVAACGGGDDDGGGGGGDIDGGAGAEDAAALDAAAPDAGPAADLVVLGARATASLVIDQQDFAEGSCALVEGCIGASGTRTLLRFDTVAVNRGDATLELPVPADGEPWVYGACHDHYHLEGFNRYDLVDGDGNTVAQTRYDAFCVDDFEPIDDGAADEPVFECGASEPQGLSVGWGWTLAGDGIPCQWIDITDIEPGDYDLHITVNDDGVGVESDYANNTAVVPVTIPE